MTVRDFQDSIDEIVAYAKDIQEYDEKSQSDLERARDIMEILKCINGMVDAKKEIVNKFGLTEEGANDEISKMINGIEKEFISAKTCLENAVSEKDIEEKISALITACGFLRNFKSWEYGIQYLMTRIRIGGMENDNQ